MCIRDSSIAVAIVQICNIAEAAINFFIPHKYVSTAKVTMKWRVVDASDSSHYNTIIGYHDTVTESGNNYGDVHISGDYFLASAFTSHDTIFAITVYNRLFAYPYYSVKSWIS